MSSGLSLGSQHLSVISYLSDANKRVLKTSCSRDWHSQHFTRPFAISESLSSWQQAQHYWLLWSSICSFLIHNLKSLERSLDLQRHYEYPKAGRYPIAQCNHLRARHGPQRNETRWCWHPRYAPQIHFVVDIGRRVLSHQFMVWNFQRLNHRHWLWRPCSVCIWNTPRRICEYFHRMLVIRTGKCNAQCCRTTFLGHGTGSQEICQAFVFRDWVLCMGWVPLCISECIVGSCVGSSWMLAVESFRVVSLPSTVCLQVTAVD